MSSNRARLRDWLGLAVLALPTILTSMDATVLYLALPHLSAELRPDATETLWIIDVYGFMIAGFLIAMGSLGDRIGRRRLLMLGASAFGVASVAAAYAPSAELLIAARALLGVAGATLMPSTLALISNMFKDARQRGLAIGVWATSLSVGLAAGPLIGGLLLEWFWWGSAFLVNVPVMALLLLAGPLLLPEYRDRAAGGVDPASVALSLAAVLPVVYGLKQLAEGDPAVAPVLALVLGSVMGVLFVRRQHRLADPLLDPRLFAGRGFTVALVILLIGLVTIGGTYLFVTQYVQSVANLSPFEAGLWLLPAALVMIVTSMLAPILVRRIRPAHVVAVALAVSALGYGLLAVAGSLPLVVAGFVVVYAGVGPMMALGTDLVVGAAAPDRAGAAAALSETSMELGVALGVATLGTVGTAIFRAAGVGATLEEAVAAARSLPGAAGQELMEATRAAFEAGFGAVAAISAILAAGLAVLAATALRHLPPTEATPPAGRQDAVTAGRPGA
ncbi:MFS transporter [Nonomuraea dietziae]|uniref:MFS transporter n=1 Tax=Nonomuraea dietziae TaxID=65515 RepID=UPI0034129D85